MVKTEAKPDMMIVVGGFNSSNTSHLQEIPEMEGVPSFWVNSSACIDVQRNHISHKTAHGDMVVSDSFAKGVKKCMPNVHSSKTIGLPKSDAHPCTFTQL